MFWLDILFNIGNWVEQIVSFPQWWILSSSNRMQDVCSTSSLPCLFLLSHNVRQQNSHVPWKIFWIWEFSQIPISSSGRLFHLKIDIIYIYLNRDFAMVKNLSIALKCWLPLGFMPFTVAIALFKAIFLFLLYGYLFILIKWYAFEINVSSGRRPRSNWGGREQEIPTLTASPDAETTILFTSHPEQGVFT